MKTSHLSWSSLAKRNKTRTENKEERYPPFLQELGEGLDWRSREGKSSIWDRRPAMPCVFFPQLKRWRDVSAFGANGRELSPIFREKLQLKRIGNLIDLKEVEPASHALFFPLPSVRNEAGRDGPCPVHRCGWSTVYKETAHHDMHHLPNEDVVLGRGYISTTSATGSCQSCQ